MTKIYLNFQVIFTLIPEPEYKRGLHLKWDGTKIVKDDEVQSYGNLLGMDFNQKRKKQTLAETDWVVTEQERTEDRFHLHGEHTELHLEIYPQINRMQLNIQR